MIVRTRMAPSPTGELHIGSLRTLLYNFALAKKNNGAFILRIEDTDKVREIEDGVQKIIDVVKDYSLFWDEGPGVDGPYAPYIQSQRLEVYQAYAQQLVEANHAYYCFCSKERLEKVKEEQQSKGFPVTKYDKHCSTLSATEVKDLLDKNVPYVIRLRIPEDETLSWKDAVLGEVSFNSKELDDQVLQKSDGYPTYHLAVVVDDHLMEISHVLRGIEWLPSTPKHILLYKAFGWTPPIHLHLPNLKEADSNKKLSKRFGDVSSRAFLEKGYLPEAILNFLMFLGWNPGTEKEIYSLDEFINDFTLEKIHTTDLIVFDRQKLIWFNGCYIRAMSDETLLTRILDWADKYNVSLDIKGLPKEKQLNIISLLKDRIKILSEVNMLTKYFVIAPNLSSDLLSQFTETPNRAHLLLENFYTLFGSIDNSNWNKDNLDNLCHNLIKELNFKPKEAFMTLRIAITGETATPPVFDILELLGKDEVLKRIGNSLKFLT